MSRTLNDFQQKSFSDEGYLAINPLFDDAKIAEINQELERFIVDVVPTMPTTHVYYEDKADSSSLKQLQNIFQYDSYFNDLMTMGTIRSMAEELLQDEVVPINMQYFNKPAGSGLATPPHQDGYYFHLTPCEAVTGWLALEDVDEENGCIRYVKGSHLKPTFRAHGKTGVIGFSQGISDFGTTEDKANTVAIQGSAGTFLIHNAKTIHFAEANLSDTRSRRALGFIYYAQQAKIDANAQNAYQKSLDIQLKSDSKI
ncbi:MAG: phytanoyl-CoA hydroxylase [Granulosicoccus sp.]